MNISRSPSPVLPLYRSYSYPDLPRERQAIVQRVTESMPLITRPSAVYKPPMWLDVLSLVVIGLTALGLGGFAVMVSRSGR